MPRVRRVGIIGIGKLGAALISGLLRSSLKNRISIVASDAIRERRDWASKTFGIECLATNGDLVRNSDVVVLAVQPGDAKAVLEDVRSHLTSRHLLVSVMTGVSMGFMARTLKKDLPTVRAMPNSPCAIGEGVTAIAAGEGVSEGDLSFVKGLFEAVGVVVTVKEELLNAVTGLSGSGPGYAYLTIEAMADAGVKVGLPKDLALLLAAQTMLGSARMVLRDKEHPAKLRDAVATPSGTTVTGIYELEKAGLRAAFINAVEKATKRAEELSLR